MKGNHRPFLVGMVSYILAQVFTQLFFFYTQDVNAEVEMNEGENPDCPSQPGRIRARFVKLNKELTQMQRANLCERLFGGSSERS